MYGEEQKFRRREQVSAWGKSGKEQKREGTEEHIWRGGRGKETAKTGINVKEGFLVLNITFSDLLYTQFFFHLKEMIKYYTQLSITEH